MAKFWIVDVCLTVEADSAQAAKEKAEEFCDAASAELGHTCADYQWEISGVPAAADDDTLPTPD